MFKFTKAKTAADTEGSESKDTYERLGNRRQRDVLWAKTRGVYMRERNPARHLTQALSAGGRPGQTRGVPGKSASEHAANNTGEPRHCGRGFPYRFKNFN